MALQSKWFHGNARLESCLVSDPSHVKIGDQGDHVALLQGALLQLGKRTISDDEQAEFNYGQSTACAVLDYKSKRKIINAAYQTSADNIVGRMTIRSLDQEMAKSEQNRNGLLLAFGLTASPSKMAIVSEPPTSPAFASFRGWANNVEKVNSPNVIVLEAPGSGTAEANVKVIKKAIAAANGGMIIMSVGHGVCLNQDEGATDLAPGHAMRVTGRNSKGTGFISVFYDLKLPNGLSDKEFDEQNPSVDGQKNLKHWAIYQDLCSAFATGNAAAVLLLTCKVGGAGNFLKRIAEQWKTPVIGYKDQVMAIQTKNGKDRAILARDKNRENAPFSTNTPQGEVFFPLSLSDMVRFNPPASKTP